MKAKKYLVIVYVLMYMLGMYILWDYSAWGKNVGCIAGGILCISALVCYIFHMYIDKNK